MVWFDIKKLLLKLENQLIKLKNEIFRDKSILILTK